MCLFKQNSLYTIIARIVSIRFDCFCVIFIALLQTKSVFDKL